MNKQIINEHANYANTLKAIEYLNKKFKINKNKTLQSLPEIMFRKVNLMKFRKSVIAVIFVNRLKNKNQKFV